MERVRTTIAVLIALLLVSVVFTCCTMSGDNGVDTEDDHVRIAKWVTIDGDDYDPNTDCFAPLFDDGANVYEFAIDSDGILHVIRGAIGRFLYFKRKGSNWVNAEGRTIYEIQNTEDPLLGEISPPLKKCGVGNLKIDSDGYPHVVGINNQDIVYMRWDGSEWVTIHGEKAYSNVRNARLGFKNEDYSCCNGQLQLDSNNYPHIYWTSIGDNTNVNAYPSYLHWDGEKWLTADGRQRSPGGLEHIITNNIPYVYLTKMLLGPDEQPYIYMLSPKRPSIYTYYLYFNGYTWCNLSCEADGKYKTQIEIDGDISFPDYDLPFDLDNDGNPVFAWQSEVYPNRIAIARSDGKCLRNLDGDEFNGDNAYLGFYEGHINSISPVIKVDNNDDLHLVWHDSGVFHKEKGIYQHNQAIYYARYDGTNWFTIDGRIIDPITRGVSHVSLITSKDWYEKSLYFSDLHLLVDDNNIPHIFWEIDDTCHYVKGIPVE